MNMHVVAAKFLHVTRHKLAVLPGVLLIVASFTLQGAEAQFLSIALDQAAGAKALASYKETDAWAAAPQNRQTFEGVPFDVLHKWQLAGNVDSRDGRLYVARSIGLPVGERLARLHLLHAANIRSPDDEPIAALRVRYENGTTQTLFVTYGVHVRNYYKDNIEGDRVSDANSRAVWVGRRPESPVRYLRLYKSAFVLRSDSPVEAIDAFSLFGRSSLVIFAVTGEVADETTKGVPAPSPDHSQYRDDLVLKVLDREGRPIGGAKVSGVAHGATNRTITLGRMDDSASEPGVVAVDFPARTRELRLAVSANDFVSVETVLQRTGRERLPGEVTVHLDRGVRIGGMVNDPDGEPVAKAKVAIYRLTQQTNGTQSLFRYDESTTDRRGRWSAREVPESLENLRFEISHPDFRTTVVDFPGKTPLTREALLSSKAEFKFTSNPQVSGMVRNEAGQPLVDTQVTFIRTNSAGKEEVTHFRTDAQGRFRFVATEAGRARLLVRAPNLAPVVHLLDLDQPLAPADLVLKAGKPFKIRAVEAQTRVQPVAGRRVRNVTFSAPEFADTERSELRGEILWTAQADANSEAVWANPLQSTPHAPATLHNKVLIRAAASGFHTEWKWVDPNAGEETIALHPYVPWRVRAIDAETKAPIPNFTTMNYNATNLSSGYGPITARNGEAVAGFFVDAWLKPRLLTIEAPGYEKFRVTLVPVLGATDTYELQRATAPLKTNTDTP